MLHIDDEGNIKKGPPSWETFCEKEGWWHAVKITNYNLFPGAPSRVEFKCGDNLFFIDNSDEPEYVRQNPPGENPQICPQCLRVMSSKEEDKCP